MLPPFIIDQIRRREEDRRKLERTQPRLELPIGRYDSPGDGGTPGKTPDGDDDDADRGVVIVDLG